MATKPATVKLVDRLPVLQKCCFCLDLYLGGFIIGILSMVFYGMFILLSCLGITFAEVVLNDEENFNDGEYVIKEEVIVGISIMTIFIVIGMIAFVLGFFLVIGIYQRRPNLIAPYLYVYFVLLVLHIFGAIMDYQLSFWNATVYVLLWGVSVYWLLCVYSAYRVMIEEKKRGCAVTFV